ncbi:MAG: sensor histidine kinase [Nitrospirae bacterium]|nr:sensor histidine kinase [Nitrospirota bacterium]
MLSIVQNSLKAKLFLLFFSINLAGIMLVGLISYQSKREALRSQVEDNLSVISSELADKVDRYLSERMNDTRAIALHYSLRGVKTTTSSQNALLAEYMRIYPYYEHISIINVEDVRPPSKCEQPYPCCNDWYLPAMAGKVISSDMYLSALTDKPTMSFAAPIRDERGVVVSIITTNLKLDYLWDIVAHVAEENRKSGLTGYAYMINSSGVIIAHPDTRKILDENALDNPEPSVRAMIKAMVSGATGKVDYTYEGVSKTAAFAPCKGFGDYAGHGWSMGVNCPHSELYAPLKPLLEKYIALFLVTSLVMFYVSSMIAGYIVRPVRVLKENASRIGAGNFNLRVHTNSSDEIGDLEKSFNRMAETLETRDAQIREYTNTLTSINRELAVKQDELSRANTVLKNTNDEMRKLEKQKSEFMAMITHDIKSPLSTVITYAEMILGGVITDGGPELKKAVGSIHASGYKILSLVDNFLASSAIEAGKLQLNLRQLDIADFIEDEMPFFTPQMDKKNIVFTLNVEPDIPTVMADKMQLDRVFANIISNAIKYTPSRGGVSVKAGTAGDNVFISVSDTGPGIDPDEVENMFNKYMRAKDTSKFEGIGLGLFIAKAIVEAHGGVIDVQSTSGEGSTFTINLPARGTRNDAR